MSHTRKIILIAMLIALIALGFALYPTISFHIETHNFTPDYIAWKYHNGPIPAPWPLSQNIVVDHDRDSLVRGLTIDQLRAKFADIRTDNFTDYQQGYEKDTSWSASTPHAWLGPTQWVIIFENRRATGLRLIKG